MDILNENESKYLVPLYKPDGSLMTGEELKATADDNTEIIIYENENTRNYR